MTDTTTPPPARVKRVRSKSRPQRWGDAVANAQKALAGLKSAADALTELLGELREVQEEYSEWKENLPDNLQSGALAEKLDGVVDLDIEGSLDTLDSIGSDIEELLGEAEGIDLPRGFGRD
jgi:hypothetical protein